VQSSPPHLTDDISGRRFLVDTGASYNSSFVGGGTYGTALEESRRPGYTMLGGEAVGD
jgi:hypothetical protein